MSAHTETRGSFPRLSGCLGRLLALLRYPTLVIPVNIHIIVVIIPRGAHVKTGALPSLGSAVETGNRANIHRFPLESAVGARRVRGEVEVPRVRRRVLHRLQLPLEILL